MRRGLLALVLIAAIARAEEPVAEPVPELPGELLVFDLRRLELFRCDPDGTRLRDIHVSVGDPKATAAIGAASGTAAAATYLSIAGSGTLLASSTYLTTAVSAGAGAVIAAPGIGITKLVQVLRRHGRPVRTVAQVQPVATLAPDGSALLFASDIGKSADRGLMKWIALGGERGVGTRTQRRYLIAGFAPDISPDGRHAVLTAPPRKKEAAEIWRLDLDSGRSIRLTTDGAPKSFPRHSPSGDRIAFQQLVVEGDDVRYQVFVMPAGGGDAVRLTRDELGAVTPSWSADGASVLYGSLADGKIHRVRADGSDDVALTDGGMIKLHPQESPDGTHVMYLESSREPAGLDPPPEAARKSKPLVGKDFRLQLVRLADARTWEVDLRRGDRSSRAVESTNLLWFQWRRPPTPA